MIDGQFELDGFAFGSPADSIVVLTSGWDVGGYTVRNQDVPAPQGDHLYFGRDYHTPGVWTFTLAFRDDHDVRPILSDFAARWRRSRLTPGEVSVLRYQQNGQIRRVFGRPRSFDIEKDDVTDHTFKLVTCTFQLQDTYSYSDALNVLNLDLITTSHEEGLTFPADFPWEFQSDGFVRKGMVTIGGDQPTPFRVVIQGPLDGQATNFKLWSTTGWRMEFSTYLSTRGNLVVDTSRGSVKRNSVAFGSLKGRSDYLARLEPGAQEIVFEANDPTFTSTARIEWREVSPIA